MHYGYLSAPMTRLLKSGYSFIRESAGLLKQEELVDISHHFRLIDTEISDMPSIAFCGCLTQLSAGAADKQKYESAHNDGQKNFTNKR
jgi:hypothetical protein